MYIVTVMLLARGEGLHTCAQEARTYWHKTVASFLGLPAEYVLSCGMAMGYGDLGAPINTWQSPPRTAHLVR
jgi:nitroreductase